jgi:hypothetical protein
LNPTPDICIYLYHLTTYSPQSLLKFVGVSGVPQSLLRTPRQAIVVVPQRNTILSVKDGTHMTGSWKGEKNRSNRRHHHHLYFP